MNQGRSAMKFHDQYEGKINQMQNKQRQRRKRIGYLQGRGRRRFLVGASRA